NRSRCSVWVANTSMLPSGPTWIESSEASSAPESARRASQYCSSPNARWTWSTSSWELAIISNERDMGGQTFPIVCLLLFSFAFLNFRALRPPTGFAEKRGDGRHGEGAYEEGVKQQSAPNGEAGLDHGADGADHQSEHAGGEDDSGRSDDGAGA